VYKLILSKKRIDRVNISIN